MIKQFFLIIALFFPFHSFATEEENLAVLLQETQGVNFSKRIDFLSSYFLEKNSSLGPLGEANFDIFDRDPIYSFSDFDCTTYVETVMALSLSRNLRDFQSNIIKIRYKDGKINFKSRNHFISLDWIPNNSDLGILEDITKSVGPSLILETVIDKKNWYKKLNLSSIKGREDLSDEEKMLLLENLRILGKDFEPIRTKLPFIKINEIFNPQILKNIPNGSIISIVRLNWDLTETIGTYLDISHQGLAIWKNGVLVYRHASLEYSKVMDIPLLTYLKRFEGNEEKIGINIQKILTN